MTSWAIMIVNMGFVVVAAVSTEPTAVATDGAVTRHALGGTAKRGGARDTASVAEPRWDGRKAQRRDGVWLPTLQGNGSTRQPATRPARAKAPTTTSDNAPAVSGPVASDCPRNSPRWRPACGTKPGSPQMKSQPNETFVPINKLLTKHEIS